jgi:hypothetical protein
VRDAQEFEDAADKFLGGAKPVHVLECIRRQGDIVRFDPKTDEFGVLGWTDVFVRSTVQYVAPPYLRLFEHPASSRAVR